MVRSLVNHVTKYGFRNFYCFAHSVPFGWSEQGCYWSVSICLRYSMIKVILWSVASNYTDVIAGHRIAGWLTGIRLPCLHGCHARQADKNTSPRRASLPPYAEPVDQSLPESFDHLYNSRHLASNFTIIQVYPTRHWLVNFIRQGTGHRNRFLQQKGRSKKKWNPGQSSDFGHPEEQ